MPQTYETNIHNRMKRMKGIIPSFHLKVLIILNLLLISSLHELNAQAEIDFEVKKVVIDPGHGGKDPGNLGTKRYKKTESNIALEVGLKLKKYILEHYDNVEVIMTRDKDVFIGLHERTKIANEANADLFISIHCNTVNNTKPFGTETYIMGLHKEKSNLEVAKRENQVIYMEDNYEQKYDGYNPDSPESMIALSMMQQEFRDQSIYLANLVEKQFKNRVKRHSRGVKQAGYIVISKTVMPSVLVELGFLSNHKEEDFLLSEKGQVYMASALYRAFKDYKTAMEGKDTSIKGGSKKEVKDTTPKTVKSTKPAVKTKKQKDEVVFKVQIVTSPKKIATKPQNFKGIKGVEEFRSGKQYKYTVGKKKTFQEALVLQRNIRKHKYKDAFVIAFFRGERIPLREAKKLTNKK